MIVKRGQSFIDMVMQGTGALDAAFEMAVSNGRSLTQALATGDTIQATEVVNKRIVSLFTLGKEPTSAINQVEQELAQSNLGIGEMVIEQTFIVG